MPSGEGVIIARMRFWLSPLPGVTVGNICSPIWRPSVATAVEEGVTISSTVACTLGPWVLRLSARAAAWAAAVGWAAAVIWLMVGASAEAAACCVGVAVEAIADAM